MRDVRVVLVGDEGAGKSSIISALIKCVASPLRASLRTRTAPSRATVVRCRDHTLTRSPPPSAASSLGTLPLLPHLRLDLRPSRRAEKPLSASHLEQSSPRSRSRPRSPRDTT